MTPGTWSGQAHRSYARVARVQRRRCHCGEDRELPELLPNGPDQTRPFNESSLHVYTEPARGPRDDVVVLVHGLAGHGNKTWNRFAPRIYSNSQLDADVGVFNYRSGWRRRPLNSPELGLVVEELVSELTKLPHVRIHLVGHSMGGIIAVAALRHSFMAQRAGPRALNRVSSMTLIASPRAGSRMSPFHFSKDMKYIGVHTPVQRDNDTFIKTWVDTSTSPSGSHEYSVPTFATVATGDRWVDGFSSTHGIDGEQVLRLAGTHTGILKKFTVADWVAERIGVARETRTQRRHAPELPVIASTFRCHATKAELFDTYYAAIDDFRSAGHPARLIDMTNSTGTHPVLSSGVDELLPTAPESFGARLATSTPSSAQFGLHVRVVPVEFAGAQQTESDLENLRTDLLSQKIHAVGVTPYGADSGQWELPFEAHLGSGPTTWIRGTDSPEALRAEIASWLVRSYRLVDRVALSQRGLAPRQGN